MKKQKKKLHTIWISKNSKFWSTLFHHQWWRNEIFLGEDLFNKIFWNYKFLAKYISTIQKFRGVTSLRFSPVPPSLCNEFWIGINSSSFHSLILLYLPVLFCNNIRDTLNHNKWQLRCELRTWILNVWISLPQKSKKKVLHAVQYFVTKNIAGENSAEKQNLLKQN